MTFRFAVQRGGGFVENENWARSLDGARYSDALALSSGKFYAPFTDQRIQTLRHLAYEFHRMCSLCGSDDFCFRYFAHLAISDIGSNRVVE